MYHECFHGLRHSVIRLHTVSSLKLGTRVDYFIQYYELLFCVEALSRSPSAKLVLRQYDVIRTIICSLHFLF